MYQVYQTGFGDTLGLIAEKFNISIEELKSINNDLKDQIQPGTLIVVPSMYNNFTKYIVKEGDSIYKIARDYNTEPNIILLINGLDKEEYIYPGEIILIPKEGLKVYITKDNTTIEDLKSLSSLEKILELNSKIYLMPDQAIIYGTKSK